MIVIPIHQRDAFTTVPFAGNPAAVCTLDEWLPDATLAAIAAENNLSETAFLVAEGPARFALRWFTPTVEVDLCGHATLASASVVFDTLAPDIQRVEFATRSGTLTALRHDDSAIELDFPARPPAPCADPPAAIAAGLGARPTAIHDAPYWLAVFDDVDAVARLAPDMRILMDAERPVVCTAPGADEFDFVSRFFGPTVGVPEDPVTGSAHCTLTPYWARELGRTRLHARQISRRGGELRCELRGDRVALIGHVASYLEGVIRIG